MIEKQDMNPIQFATRSEMETLGMVKYCTIKAKTVTVCRRLMEVNNGIQK
jgi:hypothetical protein